MINIYQGYIAIDFSFFFGLSSDQFFVKQLAIMVFKVDVIGNIYKHFVEVHKRSLANVKDEKNNNQAIYNEQTVFTFFFKTMYFFLCILPLLC